MEGFALILVGEAAAYDNFGNDLKVIFESQKETF